MWTPWLLSNPKKPRHKRDKGQTALEFSLHLGPSLRKVLEFAFDCAMDSTDPDSRSYVSQDKCYQMMAKRWPEGGCE